MRADGTTLGCTIGLGGLAYPVNRLKPLWPKRVIVEVSGGYEDIVAAGLGQAGLPVASVNAHRVRMVVGAIGRLGKTNTRHPGVITHFADVIRP